MRARGTWTTTALVSAALLLTGCTGSSPKPTETLADGTAPASPVASASTAVSPSPAASSPSTGVEPGSGTAGSGGSGGGGTGGGGTHSGGGGGPAPAAQPCSGSDLSVTVAADPRRSEMGKRAFRITFTNTSGTACTLKGYPQVAATGRGSHTAIGQPAEPDERYTPKTERLAPGGSRAAILLADNIDEHGGPYGDGETDRCGTAAGDGYFVSAPEDAKVFQVSRSGMFACTTEVVWMHVSPVLQP